MQKQQEVPLSPLAESALGRVSPQDAARILRELNEQRHKKNEVTQERSSGFHMVSMDDLSGADRNH